MLALWNFWTALDLLPVLVKIDCELAFGDYIRVIDNFIIFLESPRSQHLDK